MNSFISSHTNNHMEKPSLPQQALVLQQERPASQMERRTEVTEQLSLTSKSCAISFFTFPSYCTDPNLQRSLPPVVTTTVEERVAGDKAPGNKDEVVARFTSWLRTSVDSCRQVQRRQGRRHETRGGAYLTASS